MAFILKPERSEGFKMKAIRGQKYTFFEFECRLLFFDRLKRECLFFIWQAFWVLFEGQYMCTGGGGANVTPINIATPTFYSHAHKGFCMILVDFYIDRSRIGLLGSKGTRPLWAWPCGCDLCGRGKSSLCSLWPCPQGHAHKATPTKTPPFGTQKANFRSINVSIFML